MRWLALAALVACRAAPAPVQIALVPAERFAGVDAEVIAEQGDATYLFGHDAIRIVRGGGIVTTAATPGPALAWTSAAAIPALDGEGRWIVATRADGALVRVTLAGELEDIRERFGLGQAHVLAIVAAGSTVALRLADGVAVTTDGVHLARYAGATGTLAVARDRLALVKGDALEVWDLAGHTRRTLPIAHAVPAFVQAGDRATLLVWTDRALYMEDAGALRRVPTPPGRLEVAVAGPRVWVRTTLASGAATLATLDHGTLVPTAVAPDAVEHLVGSPTGDVWLAPALAGHATVQLARYSLDRRHDDPAWRAQVEPVFQRVCAHCHLPGGEAGIDLSTAAAWTGERDEIARRVLVTRTMPPAGTELPDADRAALERWLDAMKPR